MLAEALQAEVDAYIAQFTDERDEDGCRLVVRNGYHAPRRTTSDTDTSGCSWPRGEGRSVPSG